MGALLETFVDEYGGPGTPLPASTGLAPEPHLTDLTNGEDWTDLTFDDRGTTEWKLTALVENATDPEESLLRLWVTTITFRTSSSCRVWLNAAPDTDNYKLRWEVA